MKNITVSIDEHTHRQARIKAAEMGTSISALVRDYLKSLVAEPVEKTAADDQGSETTSEHPRGLRELLEDWQARGIGLKMSETLPRDQLYDRNAFR